ncbi:hypothetical protein [Shimia haliotis]|uniref:Uncharacterized protein n=1 Tax=Shimia haliotis TaxID=1280847 RepID=A0A1I4AAK1_9RHOB|nr:hypothetical protein [Shimia haliotis]SFK53452.1 hypothetical protein SAMN04488036_101259 [Shimia haliotis]
MGIAIGENGQDTIDHHTAVLAHAIRNYCVGDVDHDRLQKLDPFEVDIQTFHGPWFDCEKGLLVNKGRVTTKAGISTVDPYFVDIADYSFRSSNGPELWQPGGFAYAFCDPPYGLRTERSVTQNLYIAITSQLIPNQDVKIYNWHRKELLEAVPQLRDGTEWWGVFALTIFVPTSCRLFGLIASSTD